MAARTSLQADPQVLLAAIRSYYEPTDSGAAIDLPDPAPLCDEELYQLAEQAVQASRALIKTPQRFPQGTPWQQEVWRSICAIPVGETRSYSDLAKLLGRPRSSRAVAAACASNAWAVVVPCHRVVSKDGSISGYRWGIRWKRALIEVERSLA